MLQLLSCMPKVWENDDPPSRHSSLLVIWALQQQDVAGRTNFWWLHKVPTYCFILIANKHRQLETQRIHASPNFGSLNKQLFECSTAATRCAVSFGYAMGSIFAAAWLMVIFPSVPVTKGTLSILGSANDQSTITLDRFECRKKHN